MAEDPRGDARRKAAEQQADRDRASIELYGLRHGWVNAPGPQRIPRKPRRFLGRLWGRDRRRR